MLQNKYILRTQTKYLLALSGILTERCLFIRAASNKMKTEGSFDGKTEPTRKLPIDGRKAFMTHDTLELDYP